MRKRDGLFVVISFLLVFSMALVLSQGLEPIREQRLKYGPSLYITNVHTHPEAIQPGSEAIISFPMENVAPHELRDIVIELTLPAQFAPLDVSKQKRRVLGGLEKTEMNFSVVALPNSNDGIYTIPFKVDYLDEIGNEYSENNSISVRIAAKPNLYTELTSSDLYEGNLLGKINVKIANIGDGDLKFIVAELLPSDEYEIIGTNKDYVGALISDDYETIDFTIKAAGQKKQIAIKMRIDYSDANNKEYSEIVEIPLKILSATDAGIKKSNNNLFIIVVVVVLILYFVYRQIRKRSKKR